ncbi:hypothetical protein V1514DRAFT_63720 [Lipomyces japonicus]|uniref:uncharacterized protein n=1 Tax=Lipomyces japonicus TaxID=56871 RepID=UPI0034D0194F
MPLRPKSAHPSDNEDDDELGALLAEEEVDAGADSENFGALDSMLGSNFALGIIPQGFGKTSHSADAVDYEDEDELADEEESEVENEQHESGDGKAEAANEDDWAKEFSDELKFKEEVLSEDEEILEDLESVQETQHYSNETQSQESKYDEDTKMEEAKSLNKEQDDNAFILNNQIADSGNTAELQHDDTARVGSSKPLRMNSLFAPEPVRLSLPKPTTIKHAENDQSKLFRSHIRTGGSIIEKPGIIHVRHVNTSIRKRQKITKKDRELSQLEKELIFSCHDWESDIVWDSDSGAESDYAKKAKKARVLIPSINDDLFWVDDDYVSGVDDDAIIEGNLGEQAKRIILDLNDVQLLVDEARRDKAKSLALENVGFAEHLFQKRYNISNDQAYELLKENYQSHVRSTIGNLTIDHSMVANRLQSPYYKVKLSKAQARSFHRPNFVVRANTVVRFSKVKHRKKKKDKGKSIQEILSTSKDLSLGDGSQYVMLEYSEEHPIVMSNFGMGSKIINYYRKKNNEDESRPRLTIGETYILGSQDRSPFWNFGFVDPGELRPTLYNRMVRAPVFKQEPRKTDFLMIRSTGGGESQKYFLRDITHLYTVGQTLPVTEIPSPRSRRVTTASKNRLKMIVYRVIHKAEKERILVKGISSHFPDQNDMQNRQRLKEFMEYQRTGDDQGYWKIKATDTLPNEEGIRSMVSPEEITLLETMHVGQQLLEDAGYGGGKEDDEQHEGMSTEEKLAPWITSKNFINATQGKAMLELHGEGDPSGRDLAFSFIRTSMKGGFKAMGESTDEKIDKSKFGGHSYNVALQQKAYEEEIVRIWAAQKKYLTSPAAFDVTK